MQTRRRPGIRALKRRLATKHEYDREAYTDAKADFIGSILRRAGD
ncbi:MAG TPA: GrpB family protein [Solirubrobacteraceae bacterium]|nr:GrpB family protein [Solirubrobacteraceae bacterium]